MLIFLKFEWVEFCHIIHLHSRNCTAIVTVTDQSKIEHIQSLMECGVREIKYQSSK